MQMMLSGHVRHSSHVIPLTLVLCSLMGCSAMSGEDFSHEVKTSYQQKKTWDYTQSNAQSVSLLTDLIAEPDLVLLVNQGLQANPSLQQTALALNIAYAQRGVTAASRLPSLSASLSGSKNQDETTQYTGDLTVSWELDLWHKLTDNVRAAEADIASSEGDYQAARDALAANIMRAWLDISLQQQRLAIEQMRLKDLQNSEKLIKQRYRSGLGQLEDLDSAVSSSAATQATIAEYEESLAQSRRALRPLLGKTELSLLPAIPATFPEVIQALANLPEQNLASRPDLQTAYANIVAEQNRSSVAYKALLPSLSLQASLTDIAANPADALFKSPAWGLLGQLTAPLFQGGQLRAEADIAEYTAEQSYWAFQQTLLDAVNEVDDALGQERSLVRQQQHIEQALAAAKRNADYYQSKYRQGLVEVLDLLSAKQQTYDLQAQLIQIKYNRLSNRIDLGLALGLGVSA